MNFVIMGSNLNNKTLKELEEEDETNKHLNIEISDKIFNRFEQDIKKIFYRFESIKLKRYEKMLYKFLNIDRKLKIEKVLNRKYV